jgi:hypothetical protein
MRLLACGLDDPAKRIRRQLLLRQEPCRWAFIERTRKIGRRVGRDHDHGRPAVPVVCGPARTSAPLSAFVVPCCVNARGAAAHRLSGARSHRWCERMAVKDRAVQAALRHPNERPDRPAHSERIAEAAAGRVLDTCAEQAIWRSPADAYEPCDGRSHSPR